MRILWHGVPPWLPTGYASQAAIWCKRLADAGHEIIIDSIAGNNHADATWEGIPVLASTGHKLAEPVVTKTRLDKFQPDLVLILGDHRHIIAPEIFQPWKTVAFIAGDCDRLSAGDADFLQRSQAYPWAISRHMQRILEESGYDAPYVPHAIDSTVFCPPADRAAVRAQVGLEPGTFAVGLVARNIDPLRKAIPEQLVAFHRFHQRHPDSRLFLHMLDYESGSNKVTSILAALGLKVPSVYFSDQYSMYLEMFPRDLLVSLYQSMDVVMNASRGEGFGLTAVESQACGTPVILADNTTGPELVGPGWLTDCDPDAWVSVHEGFQGKPLHKSLVRNLVAASVMKDVAAKRGQAREFALQFDVEAVWPLFEKALQELCAD